MRGWVGNNAGGSAEEAESGDGAKPVVDIDAGIFFNLLLIENGNGSGSFGSYALSDGDRTFYRFKFFYCWWLNRLR